VPNVANIDLFVKAGKDYELAVPSLYNLMGFGGYLKNPTATPVVHDRMTVVAHEDLELHAMAGTSIGTTENKPKNTEFKQMNQLAEEEPVQFIPHIHESVLDKYFGEGASLEALLKRKQRLGIFSFDTSAQADVGSEIFIVLPVTPMLPMQPQWNVSGNAPFITTISQTAEASATFLEHYGHCADTWRGSLRYVFDYLGAIRSGNTSPFAIKVKHSAFFLPAGEQVGLKNFSDNIVQGFPFAVKFQPSTYGSAATITAGTVPWNFATFTADKFHRQLCMLSDNAMLVGCAEEELTKPLEVTVPFFDNHPRERTTKMRYNQAGGVPEASIGVPTTATTGVLVYRIRATHPVQILTGMVDVSISAGDDFAYGLVTGGSNLWFRAYANV